jgi:diaminohydroxyphosphoribosylaminopyrimidine deaminase/5-amino-6-(5-phosphoribosylamino)uracil reductase
VRVTLKLATSLDGRIATASGESKWITGEPAREQVHKLRAMHRAVLVGVETAITDNPELTVRLPGYVGPQPVRVVLDSKQRIPSTLKLVADAGRIPTVVIANADSVDRLAGAKVQVLKVPATDGRPDLEFALEALHRYVDARLTQGLAALAGKPGALVDLASIPPSVLVEGGGQVAASFLAAGLVDAIEWFRAPIILGDEGRPAVGEFVLDRLKDAPRFKRLEVISLGDDLWERYERV